MVPVAEKLTDQEKKHLASIYEVDENGEPLLDDNQKPIFKEVLELRLTGHEVKLGYDCGKHLLEQGLVPEPEIDSVMHLLDILANNHRPTRQKYTVQLPVNYVVGFWHTVNSCRKFDLYAKQKDLSRRVDALAIRLASYMDAHHKLKNREETFSKSPQENSENGKVIPLLK